MEQDKQEHKLHYQSTISFRRMAAQPPSSGPASIENHSSGTCTESEPFALRVIGDSMAPEFPHGSIVVVDPSVTPEHGSFVIADCEDQGHLLRQLQIIEQQAGSDWTLTALQDHHPKIKIAPNGGAIKGVIVQRSGTRRHHHKTY